MALRRAHEHRLDMHAGEIEISRVGAGLVAGDLAEAGQPQPPRPAGFFPSRMRQLRTAPSGSGAISMRASNAVQRVDDRETVEAGLLDPIVAGAPRRLEADRPGRAALLAEIEKMAARLQRVERPAEEVDRDAAALGAHDESRAAAVALNFHPDGAVVEGERLAAVARARAARRQATARRCPDLGALRATGREREAATIGDPARRRRRRAS